MGILYLKLYFRFLALVGGDTQTFLIRMGNLLLKQPIEEAHKSRERDYETYS